MQIIYQDETFSILDGNVYYRRPAFGQKADIDNY